MLCFLFSVFEVSAFLVMSKHGTADWQCIIKGQWREKSSTFSFVRGHWLCHTDWRGRLVNHAALIHHSHTQYTPVSNSDTKRPSFSYPEKTCNPQECNLNKHKRMRWRTDFSSQFYLQNIFYICRANGKSLLPNIHIMVDPCLLLLATTSITQNICRIFFLVS